MIKTWRPESEAAELSRCHRFCYSIVNDSVFTSSDVSIMGLANTTNTVSALVSLPVPLRVLPTLVVNMASGFVLGDGSNAWTTNSFVIGPGQSRPDFIRIAVTTSGTPLTQFRNYFLRAWGSGSVNLTLDAGL